MDKKKITKTLSFLTVLTKSLQEMLNGMKFNYGQTNLEPIESGNTLAVWMETNYNMTLK